ncbi:MFS transporter [Xylanimonas sp. McL0601]|uniref:MFS transporter n=1 Tax=Xylanimonas sp. McL0601 TaxID=3414739 RepID=UPI003CF9915E
MPPAPPSTKAQLQRVRWALIAMFGLFGIMQTSWMGRLPSIRESLDISAGSLGAVLVAGAVGSLIGVTVIGPVIVRYGSAVTLRIGMLGNLVGFALVGVGTALGSVEVFTLGVLLNGLVGPATNVPINLEAARVEKLLGRAVLPHVHAAFSVGALVGSAVAATTSTLHVHVVWHIVGVAALVAAGRSVLIAPGTELQDEPLHTSGRSATKASAPGDESARHDDAGRRRAPRRRRTDAGSALRAWAEPRTLLIGLVLLAATMSEGAAANWLNLAVVDGFATREAVGAMAYGTFVVSMLTVRLLGAGLIDRFGRVAVLRVSGVSALLGLLAFGLGPSLPFAWVGIVLWGAGAAMAYPVGTAAAADDPSKAAARVSVVGSFGSIASLSAPPVLGLLADAWGTRHALLLITLAMVVSLAAAGQVRQEAVERRHGKDATGATAGTRPGDESSLEADLTDDARADAEHQTVTVAG